MVYGDVGTLDIIICFMVDLSRQVTDQEENDHTVELSSSYS